LHVLNQPIKLGEIDQAVVISVVLVEHAVHTGAVRVEAEQLQRAHQLAHVQLARVVCVELMEDFAHLGWNKLHQVIGQFVELVYVEPPIAVCVVGCHGLTRRDAVHF